MSDKMLLSELLAVFENSKITLGYVVRRDGAPVISHPELAPLREAVSASPGFADHEGVFVGWSPKFKTLFFAFVHNTGRGLAQGGLRMMKYGDVEAVLNDGLRLAQGMSRKNAICGLWWGGGKGIIPLTDELKELLDKGIAEETDPEKAAEKKQKNRDELFAAYGEFVARLNGIYYTAADIGTYNLDMKAVLTTNRFVTCIPRALGGSGDPSPHTAEGVFRAIKIVREHLKGTDDLTDVTVAVQGTGKVGRPLIEKLVGAGAKVWASDVQFENEAKLAEFKNAFPNVTIVSSAAGHENDILALEVEIVAPCAIGGTINKETIELLKPTVEIVCGGANNILGRENEDGELLYQKGIVFVPDFLCNWMGIANCANEAFGYLEEDVEAVLNEMREIVEPVLNKADTEKISHTAAAHQLADEKIKELPPLELLRNRGQRLIANLIENFDPNTKSKSA